MTYKLFAFVSLLLVVDGELRQNAIKIENNGFSNVLIAIDEDVPENLKLITNIKDAFTHASRFLHKATRKRAYLKEIFILVPSSWPDKTSYEPALAEYYTNADILVSRSDAAQDYGPFVKTFSPCGSPGEYMQITDKYFLDVPNAKKDFGPVDKLLVHEWAHLRWGVFDEYASPDEKQVYYTLRTESYEPVKCSSRLTGSLTQTVNGRKQECHMDQSVGKYPAGCTFTPDRRQRGSIVASIMDRQYVESINTFCDSSGKRGKQHSNDAPNRHNRMCSGRSTWDVIISTPDFSSGNNPPRDIAASDLEPKFRILRHKANSLNVILVLDVSGSMNSAARKERTMESVTAFIWNIKNGTELGIVAFQTTARIVLNMTKIVSQQSRIDILKKTNPKFYGGTSIGSGLLQAIEMIQEKLSNKEAVSIVLISDGKETADPRIANALPKVLKSQVTVHCIAYSKQADNNISTIASATGGKFYYDKNAADSTDMMQAMIDITNTFNSIGAQETEITQIFAISGDIFGNKVLYKEGVIGAGLGLETTLYVLYTEMFFELNITTPSGSIMRFNNTHYGDAFFDTKKQVLIIQLPGIAETGTWKFALKNPENWEQIMSLTLVTKAVGEPLIIRTKTSYVSKSPPKMIIITEVTQSRKAVLDLVVQATIQRPTGGPSKINLLDNGNGADLMKNDGIYSRYFVQFTTGGRYSVSVEAILPETGLNIKKKNANRAKPMVDPMGDLSKQFNKTIKRKETSINTGVSITKSGGAMSFEPDKNWDPTKDTMPPSKITDLDVVGTDLVNSSVTLTWSASGDDMDSGKATKYEIFYGKSGPELLSSRPLTQDELLKGTLTSPKPYGEKERFVIKVPYDKKSNVSYLFGVKSIDEVGNSAELSNLVGAGFGTVPAVVEKGTPKIEVVKESTTEYSETEQPNNPTKTTKTVMEILKVKTESPRGASTQISTSVGLQVCAVISLVTLALTNVT